MNKEKEIIEKIFKKRNKWVEANKENEFEDGIKNLLSDLYPDKAHFVYELLQNADDAQATDVKFKLDENSLEFSHNAKRLFTENDIDGITSIGKSPKKGDVNTIGRFGVGFKAVFGYTNTPQIHSGNYAFEIRDLVCPYLIEKKNIKENETLFVFPFDIEYKENDTIKKEIVKAIESFSEATILFLRYIEKINWDFKDNKNSIEKKCVNSFLEIKSKNENTKWLKLNKEFCIEDKKYNEEVSIAYKVEDKNIIPIDDANLCVFFPAEKETPNLKFHIHAPFVSTIARDSICDDNEENYKMRDVLVELFIESFEIIKKENLFNESFMCVLPNCNDHLDEFFNPFYEESKKTLIEKKYLLSLSGKYKTAKELCEFNEISEVISDKQLQFFTEIDKKYWLCKIEKKRAIALINSLPIQTFNLEKLYTATKNLFTEENDNLKENQEFLKEQKISWLIEYYKLLSNHKIHHHGERRQIEIILCDNGSLYNSQNIYLPPVNSELKDNDYKFVSAELIKKDTNIENSLQSFWNWINIEKLDESHQIKKILKQFYKNNCDKIDCDLHLKHIKIFIEYLNKKNDSYIFSDYKFLKNKDGEFQNSKSLYIDLPYEETNLSAFISDKDLLCAGYKDIKDINSFMKRIGCINKLGIENCECVYHCHWVGYLKSNIKIDKGQIRNGPYENIDYKIPDIIINEFNQRVEQSEIIWNIMSKSKKNVLLTNYKANKKTFKIQIVDSQLVQWLQKTAWIPDKESLFHKPCDIHREQLNDQLAFPPENKRKWLHAIHFGKNFDEKEIKNKEFEKELKEKHHISLSIEELKEYEIHKEEFLEWKNSKNTQNDFPEKTSRNRERRDDKLTEYVANSAPVEYETIPRSVRKSKQPANYKILLEQYINEDDIFVCQMCKKAMPRKNEDEYYYSAVQIPENLEKEVSAHLALCPTCSSKYKYLFRNDENKMSELLDFITNDDNDDDNNNNNNLSFELDLWKWNENETIIFTERHLGDLKVIFNELNNGDV